MSLLSPRVTAGDSSHILWGLLAGRPAQSLGRVTVGHSDTCQMKEDRFSVYPCTVQTDEPW